MLGFALLDYDVIWRIVHDRYDREALTSAPIRYRMNSRLRAPIHVYLPLQL